MRADSSYSYDSSMLDSKCIDLNRVVALRPTTDASAPAFAIDLEVDMANRHPRTFVFCPEGSDEIKNAWAAKIADVVEGAAIDEDIFAMVIWPAFIVVSFAFFKQTAFDGFQGKGMKALAHTDSVPSMTKGGRSNSKGGSSPDGAVNSNVESVVSSRRENCS